MCKINIFNKIATLKTKTNQRTEICEYQTYTSSDGNLMLILMFKTVFPNTEITDLNTSIDKKYCALTTTHACHKWQYAR